MKFERKIELTPDQEIVKERLNELIEYQAKRALAGKITLEEELMSYQKLLEILGITDGLEMIDIVDSAGEDLDEKKIKQAQLLKEKGDIRFIGYELKVLLRSAKRNIRRKFLIRD